MSLALAYDHNLLVWLAQSDASGSGQSRLTYRRVKRVLDMTIVLGAAPIWLPALLIGWTVVKLDDASSPAFYVQERTGYDGRRFKLIKLRTMKPGAHAMLSDLLRFNERVGSHFKIKNDPRITPIGRHLRRFHLDELPQLVNVLRGEMSLVGPRPTATPPSSHLPWQTERFEALPGLTCIWQLVADSYPSFDDRTRLDIWYCRRRSLGLDIRVLLWTFHHVLKGRGC